MVCYTLIRGDMPKKFTFEITESGCRVPTSHKLNKDGYFRKNMGDGRWVMFHRYIWESVYDLIPEGFEINHKCKNRACFNPDHLECIPGTNHAELTNRGRYADRIEDAHQKWLTGHWTAPQLATHFNVSESSAYGWIRKWRKL